jgi:hypothetical protein
VPEAEGLIWLNRGLMHYYLTNFKEVFEPALKSILEFERIKNREFLGMANMILEATYR